MDKPVLDRADTKQVLLKRRDMLKCKKSMASLHVFKKNPSVGKTRARALTNHDLFRSVV